MHSPVPPPSSYHDRQIYHAIANSFSHASGLFYSETSARRILELYAFGATGVLSILKLVRRAILQAFDIFGGCFFFLNPCLCTGMSSRLC